MTQKNEEILLRRIANTILLNISEVSNIGLFNGKMGIALFLYHYSRIDKNQIYDKFAEELLDNVFLSLDRTLSADISNDLAEIGWGINYLIKNKFVDADANVLDEVDTFLYELKHKDILVKTSNNCPFFSKEMYLVERDYGAKLLEESLLELKEMLSQKDKYFNLCYLNSLIYAISQMTLKTELSNAILSIIYTNIIHSIDNKYYFPADILVLSNIIRSFNLKQNSGFENEKWIGLLETLDCNNSNGIFNTGIYDMIYDKLKIIESSVCDKIEMNDVEKQVNFMIKDVNRNLSLHNGLAGIGLTLINYFKTMQLINI
jgi:hypothetical protein